MPSDSVEATLKDIVIRIVHCDEDVLTPTATWKDVKADSLDMVQILVAVEDTFNIEVPDEEAKKFLSFGDFVAYVESCVAKKEAA